MIKKYFITGLIILLPLALTLFIVSFFVDLLTDPFVDMMQAVFTKHGILDRGFGFFSAAQVQMAVIKVLILLFLFFVTVLLGLFARWVFFHYLLIFWDAILHRIPFIKNVYRTSQDVVNTLFKSDARSFKQVVIVQFPRPGSYSVGFITNDNIHSMPAITDDKLVAVFVPTTPNPTSGFVMLFKPSEVTLSDMKVEEALKFIISCGVIQPPVKVEETP